MNTERFWGNVNKSGVCWEWCGRINPAGYGMYGPKLAHRLILPLVGQPPVPKGLFVDHMCRNRKCVNPIHLRVVTSRTNSVENSLSIPAQNFQKKFCKRGHPFSAENTYRYEYEPGKQGRVCKRCHYERQHRVVKTVRPMRPFHESAAT